MGKKLYIKTLVLNLFLLVSSSLMAQSSSNDQVILRNGSIIVGTITENSNDKIKIKTNDGREYIFNKSEIEKTIQSGSESSTNNNAEFNTDKPFVGQVTKTRYSAPPKGFWLSAEIQLLSPPSLNIVAGYKFHQFGYLGLGTGIHNYTEISFTNNTRPFTATIIPIYLRYSGDILKRRVTPVYSAEIGYGIAVTNAALFINNDLYFNSNGYSAREIKSKGGIYGGLGFGFKVRTNKNISFGAGFAYRIQQSSMIEQSAVTGTVGSYLVNYKYINQRFGLKLIFVGFN